MKLSCIQWPGFSYHCTNKLEVFSHFLAMVEQLAKINLLYMYGIIRRLCLTVHQCMLEITKKKQTWEMDTTLGKCDWLEMRYRYFIDFGHGISVLANFSCGIAVLGTPLISPLLWCMHHRKRQLTTDRMEYTSVSNLVHLADFKLQTPITPELYNTKSFY